MPAMLEDPTANTIYRVSGPEPYPLPDTPIPEEISIKNVTLRDRVTIATLVPFSSPRQVPQRLMAYLCDLLNREIEKGDTYPMTETLGVTAFGLYWFANFAAVMILGDLSDPYEVAQMDEHGADWSRECLGSFYIKPNYPGRSSHVCNAGFLVTPAARNRRVGRLMGECYLDWAPKLGYNYSVFNLVYETNVASLRIWDALGFKRIGRIKGCGNLKSYPDQLIDAIIFGRELGGEGDEYVSEERFDKIRFYLKTGTYPLGSDRAEKSRLRSAATHYRLDQSPSGNDDDDKLMLKGKEVISDPHKQYEIARNMHAQAHGGINKTTATIAERYHWVRIKETVSAAIRNCTECKDPAPKSSATAYPRERRTPSKSGNQTTDNTNSAVPASAVDGLSAATADPASHHHLQSQQQAVPMANMQYAPASAAAGNYADVPVDPQIMQSMQHWQATQAQDDHHASQQAAMALGEADGSGGGAAGSESLADRDVDMRLREELQAQMLQEEQQQLQQRQQQLSGGYVRQTHR